jgi:hypothetical protein
MNWDWNYAYGVVSFVVGALAGFQAIYDRYKDEFGSAVNTPFGYCYLLSRGLIPAILFLVLYGTNRVHSYLFGLAIGLGLGTEAILRSQVQIKSRPAKNALATENTFMGFFNLLEWYQKFILQQINTRMAAKRQEIVRHAVQRVPECMPFPRVCEIVKINADALSDDKEIKVVKEEIEKQLGEYIQEIERGGGGEGTPEMQNRYQSKLGYWIYNKAGRRPALKVLFKF